MPKNATELLLLCENRLGFNPDPGHIGLRRARMIEAGKIKKKLAANPKVTLGDLALAVEYAWRKRIELKSPLGLFFMVDDAVEMANVVVQPSELSMLIQAALDWEMVQLEVDHDWVGKLTRAHGPYRSELLTEWVRSGRGG